ncbi:MAG: hypothetical protein ACXAB7_11115 [Candidatus Kariarchaeaceae archaeon]|jgi:hypothetical protein
MSDNAEGASSKEGIFKRIWNSQGTKIIVFLSVLLILVLIMLVSEDITPSRPTLDADEIIKFDSTHQLLFGLSSALLLILLISFTRLIFFDQREEFGITSYRSWRALWFLLLIISFLISVFILLDVALINIYLNLPLVSGIWKLNKEFDLSSEIPTEVDFLAYTNIRGKLFAICFGFIMIFPVLMFLIILTRVGRGRILRRDAFDRQFYYSFFKTGVTIILSLASLFIAYITYLEPSSFLDIVAIVAFLSVLAIVLFALFLILLELVRSVFHLTSINLLVVFPLAFLFYILPVIAWSAWDILVVVTDGDLSSTIYDRFPDEPINEDNLPKLYFNTLILNVQSIDRILELDFVIIIGIASLIIGFAEGYSLLSIGRAFIKGKAVLRTGRYATRSASSGVVRASRFVMLFAWFGMLWDKALELMGFLFEEFNLPFEFALDTPHLFDIAYGVSYDILAENSILLPFAILILPALIIINSSFKFLSVSLVVDKTKHDTQIFFLLISSTFVLIVTKIFVDISSISIFEEEYIDVLPFKSLTSSSFLAFAINAFSILEAVAFYAGVLFVIFIGIPLAILGKEKDKSGEI